MISTEVFVGFLNCHRKAFFKQTGKVGEAADIERVCVQLDNSYMHTALERFLGQHGGSEILRDPPLLETAIQSRTRFIVRATAAAGNLSSRLNLLERQDVGERQAPM